MCASCFLQSGYKIDYFTYLPFDFAFTKGFQISKPTHKTSQYLKKRDWMIF